MHRRVTMIVTALAVLGLMVAAPLASAKTSKTDKAQNKAIKKTASGVKKNTKAISKSTKSAAAAIAAVKVIADRGDKNGAAFIAAAPAVIQGLTDLKNGLTAAAAGLNSLKTLATSQEYGFTQVLIGAAPQAFLETPDIPDTVQQAQTNQTFSASATGNVATLFGVRSAESDGDGTTAAANCQVTVTNETAGTTATSGAAPYTPVPTKSTLTSTTTGNTGFAFGLKTNPPDADVTVAGPTLAVAANDRVSVQLNCVDLTPSAADPSA